MYMHILSSLNDLHKIAKTTATRAAQVRATQEKKGCAPPVRNSSAVAEQQYRAATAAAAAGVVRWAYILFTAA